MAETAAPPRPTSRLDRGPKARSDIGLSPETFEDRFGPIAVGARSLVGETLAETA
jgi:hypothetical protein